MTTTITLADQHFQVSQTIFKLSKEREFVYKLLKENHRGDLLNHFASRYIAKQKLQELDKELTQLTNTLNELEEQLG